MDERGLTQIISNSSALILNTETEDTAMPFPYPKIINLLR